MSKSFAGSKCVSVHVKELQVDAFCPTLTKVKIFAYKLFESYKLKHNFKIWKLMAGYDWFFKFLENASQYFRKKR